MVSRSILIRHGRRTIRSRRPTIFALHPSEAGPLARVQREQAAPLAASGDLALALPLVIPGSGYAFAAMLLLLLLLLGIRYGTQSSFFVAAAAHPG